LARKQKGDCYPILRSVRLSLATREEVKISDMTATIICANPPEKLFKILEDEFDYKILPKDDGIYYIMERVGAVEKRLAIQVAVQKSELLLQDREGYKVWGCFLCFYLKKI